MFVKFACVKRHRQANSEEGRRKSRVESRMNEKNAPRQRLAFLGRNGYFC